MEVLCSSKTLIIFYHTIERKITEDFSYIVTVMVNTNFAWFTRIFDVLTALFLKNQVERISCSMKMETLLFFLMSGTDHPTTQRDIAEDLKPQNYSQMSPSRLSSTVRVDKVRVIVDSYSPIGKSLSLTSWLGPCRSIPYLIWTPFRCFPGLLLLKIPA
jgi:hypothetical protein